MNIKKIIALLLLMLLLFSLNGCKKNDIVKAENIKNVKVIATTLSDIVIEDQYAGQINSLHQTGVVPKIPGKVSQIMVDIGSKVNKGDVLFTLDASDAASQLRQAEAAVDVAQANLNRVQSSNLSQMQIQYKSTLEQAQISYNDAETNYNRTKSLFQQGAASKYELDLAENRMLTAKQNLESARDNMELLGKGIGPDSIEGAQAQLKQALASLDAVRIQVDNTRITAPISGVVSKKNINIGEGVSTASPAVVISDINDLAAEINIPEKLINKLQVGQKLTITVDSLSNKLLEGEISNISPVADKQTFNYTVKVKIISSDSEVKPGMFAKIKLPVDQKNNVLVVPNSAIVSENGLQYIYGVKDNIIIKRPVKIGLSNNENSEIIEGLTVGENIILEGQSFFADGEKVNVVK